jgi:hypothetical protein
VCLPVCLSLCLSVWLAGLGPCLWVRLGQTPEETAAQPGLLGGAGRHQRRQLVVVADCGARSHDSQRHQLDATIELAVAMPDRQTDRLIRGALLQAAAALSAGGLLSLTEDKAARFQQRADARRQRDLPCLVHDHAVEAAPTQQRAAGAEARAADLDA